jgi:hypothetical protein
MGSACVTHGEKRNAYRILVGKPEGKRPLGILRYNLEGNIKMEIREIESGNMDWIHLAQESHQWGGSCGAFGFHEVFGNS